ncbi:MAG: hypothetical protein LVQ97_03690 [Candidatus Micrarchaeales archaeon]|jgi:hypothetical protein|uniref:Uncharacterized protein n=1 Tax=Candidatus Micrarchaeum acidiphilum ARMAN-2 TaxID=425595 RepID=C7DGI6_MICA2|nr:MAG: hypothetical protein UNLARM2_0188 [Candidatus Micrarchaeum acidiphilum ARMAN-2]MCW6161260.1 hypothetical protein [Candidatus Micrarchaeales archaeon]
MAPIKASILLSLATIILAILSISVYIFYGGSAVFYAAAVLTIIFGLANAWSISREESEMPVKAPAPQPMRIASAKHARRKPARKTSVGTKSKSGMHRRTSKA